MMTAHAAEVTERLHEDADSEVGLPLDEAICPSCSLAYFVAAGRSGVCRDCGDELEPPGFTPPLV